MILHPFLKKKSKSSQLPQVKYYSKYYIDDETWAEISVEQLAEIQETNEKLRSFKFIKSSSQ